VYRFWEENGTAYMVMPFYEGPTLRQHLQQLGHPPDEAWLRALLAPLVDALELIHNDRCWHRDIAPDNILLLAPSKTQAGAAPQLRPLLLDFGAARRVIGDVTHNLTVILKPGYAPLEQYAESDAMRQGPWTDVYALCAVLYGAVTGRAPVPSVSRVISDEMVSAVQAGAGRYSVAFLEAIDAGLAVRPDARPQSMAALRERFGLGAGRALPTAPAAGAPAAATPAARQAAAATPVQRPAGATAATPPAVPAPRAAHPVDAPAPSQGGLGKWVLVGIGSVALVIAAAAIGWGLERGTSARRAPVQASEPAPTVAPNAAPTTAPPVAVPSPPPTAAPALAAPAGQASSVVPSVPAAAGVDPTANASPSTAPSGAATAPALGATPSAQPKTGIAAPPPTAATTPTAAPAPTPSAAATRAAAQRATTAPPRAAPAKPVAVDSPTAPAIGPTATPTVAPAQAAPPAIDPKRFECEVLVRAGQKALANRSYDDAMQRADEAQSVYADCPGAVELGRNARQAKDRARSAVVIQ
jgi:Protein kinase domain